MSLLPAPRPPFLPLYLTDWEGGTLVRACTGKLACVSVGVGRVLCCLSFVKKGKKRKKRKKRKKLGRARSRPWSRPEHSLFFATRARASSSTPTKPWPAMRWSVRSWTVGAHALAPLAAGRRRSGGVLRQEMTRLTASASAPMPPPLPLSTRTPARMGRPRPPRPGPLPMELRWLAPTPVGGARQPGEWEPRTPPPPPKRRTAAPARSPPFLCAPPLNPITSFFLSLSPPPSPPQLPPARGAGAGREGHGRRLRLLRHGRRRRPVHAALAGDDRGAAQRALMEK